MLQVLPDSLVPVDSPDSQACPVIRVRSDPKDPRVLVGLSDHPATRAGLDPSDLSVIAGLLELPELPAMQVRPDPSDSSDFLDSPANQATLVTKDVWV